MLKIYLVFWRFEPPYNDKHYAYKKNMYCLLATTFDWFNSILSYCLCPSRVKLM